MPRVPAEHIKQLEDSGIYVSSPYSDNHAAFPAGHAIMPAEGVSQECSDFDENPNEPSQLTVYGGPHLLWIFGSNDKWFILRHHTVPGPGPGDFMTEWDTIDEAIADALKYFGKDERWHLIEKIDRYHKYNFTDSNFKKVKSAGLMCRRLGGIDGYRIAKTDHRVQPPKDRDEVESGYQGRVFTDEVHWYSEFAPIPPLEAETIINKWILLEEAIDDAIDFFHNRQGRDH